jgi:hypothetical protein
MACWKAARKALHSADWTV